MSRLPNGPPIEDDAFLREKESIEGFKTRVLDDEPEVISSEVISAVCQRHCSHVGPDGPDHSFLAESLALDASAIPDCFAHSGQDTLLGMKKEDWYRCQREDPSLKRVNSFLEAARKPHFRELRGEPSEVRLLIKGWKKLEFKDGVLYRKCLDHGIEVHQLVLPQKFRDCALRGIHDEVGHLVVERALSPQSCSRQILLA